MKYLAIIPARGGSKGIKNKNIIDIKGKPLLYYTINPALQLLKENIISKLILSTDSKKIAEIGAEYGVNVPFIRPADISGDKAKSFSYVMHALNYYEKQEIYFDAVIILQPTSPLRNYSDISGAINLFNETKNRKSLISCYDDETINELILYKKDNNFAIPLHPNHNKGVRRQEHDNIFIRNGAIYIVSTEFIKQTNQLFDETPLMYEMPKSRSINLDCREDLKILKRSL
ncbi:MAG: acylneuraminate cytidylyltransferase family protein [Bacteroidales bacterium]|nr:acylneuraminate cytidylyltransferase family protein [Bacteroidales bacterium]